MDDIPEGLEPAGVWDARSPEWIDERLPERIAWAEAHIPRNTDTYRAEFYLIDAPCAVVRRFAVNENGLLYIDPSRPGHAAIEEPVIVPLAELPPARLLGRG